MNEKILIQRCRECGFICEASMVCYRCRKNDLEPLVELNQFEKIIKLIRLVHGNMDNLIAEFAKDSICEINCPIARTCPQLAAESADAVEYCRIQLQNWYTK